MRVISRSRPLLRNVLSPLKRVPIWDGESNITALELWLTLFRPSLILKYFYSGIHSRTGFAKRRTEHLHSSQNRFKLQTILLFGKKARSSGVSFSSCVFLLCFFSKKNNMMAPSEVSPSQISVQTSSTQKTDTSRSAGVKVSAKAESTGVADNLELNPYYFKTVPGILKMVQLLFAILCMACGSPVVTTYTNFFMFVVATYFIITLILCIIYFFTIKRLLPSVPWLLIELIATSIGVVLYFIVSVVQLAATSRRDYHYVLGLHNFYAAYIAAGCFGLFNFVAYGAGAFFLFMEWRQSKPATNTVTIPEAPSNPPQNNSH